MSLAIQLPPHAEQTAINLEVWERFLADPELAKIEGRIESDRHGHIITTPPSGFFHGSRQATIAHGLWEMQGEGVASECPISTSDGVRAADVVWISPARREKSLNGQLLTIAPEICVEVISPSNTRREMSEKMELYFDPGAEEVWFYDPDGKMRFHGKDGQLEQSVICPGFPLQIEP